MVKKVAHTEENVLGFENVNGTLVPFWEDDQPQASIDSFEKMGKNMTVMGMAPGPTPGRQQPK